MINKTLKCLLLLPLLIFTAGHSQSNQNVTIDGSFQGSDGQGANDVWGYNAPDGEEYGMMASRAGVYFAHFNKRDGSTEEVGYIPGPTSIWHDIKTYKEYCYIVADDGDVGVQIVDLRNLPKSVSLINSYKGNDIATIQKSHNIWIDSTMGLAFLIGGGKTLILSLEDPINPEVISIIPGEAHDAYTYQNYISISNGNKGGVHIYDISDPVNPTLAGEVNIPSSGYSHNNWVTDDGNYMMTTEETGGKTVKMWDISDLSNPVIIDEYQPTSSSMAHNVYMKGDYAFLSYYGEGFRVLDISDPANMVEIAFDKPGSSVWGAYGWFNSGRFLYAAGSGRLLFSTVEGVVPTEEIAQPSLGIEFISINESQFRVGLPSEGQFSIDVYDLNGVKLMAKKMQGSRGENLVNLGSTSFPQGHQILKIQQHDKSIVSKF